MAAEGQLEHVGWRGWIRVLSGCLLLALAQMLLAGYRLGVGNQSIQIPFLRTALWPTMYAHDAAIATVTHYPTFFFQALAFLLGPGDITWAYLILHLLTTAAVFAATWALARACHPSRWSGAIAVALLAAGHQIALAGDDLYSTGFTHTWAVFPLAIAVLALAYRGRWIGALLLAGLIFNLHALTAAYLLVLCGAGMWSKEVRWKTRLLALLGFAALAAPMLWIMAQQHQAFDEQWQMLTRIRSADHVFPSEWWQSGDAGIPRFLAVIALAALALSFAERESVRRLTLRMAAGAGALFTVGIVFTEIAPVPLVMRAQLFRCSRLVVLLALVQIACGIASVLALRGKMRGWRWGAEMVSAGLTLICLAVPGVWPWLPVALVVALVIGIINGRVAWWQALAMGAALVVWVAAVAMIDVPRPALPNMDAVPSGMAWLCLSGAAVLLLAWWIKGWRGTLLGVAGVAAAVAAAITILPRLAAVRGDQWVDVQLWARDHTAAGSLFLTPIRPGGFRVYSERPVVGEWRDGTQLFFSADYGPQWWERMKALQPGMVVDQSGTKLLDPGTSLELLDDEKLIELAQRFHADYLVLGMRPGRALTCAYSNGTWGIYRPEMPKAQTPAGARESRWQAQEKFMHDVVYPNIEKNRKNDFKIQIVDSSGRAVVGLNYVLNETRQDFEFGCSLPFFEPVDASSATDDFKPEPVKPVELEKFLGIFNASLVPFSGKWMYIEPHEGQEKFDDMDKYIAWCQAHQIDVEEHFLSGYEPTWLRAKNPTEQGQLFLKHSLDMVARYGDKIKYWQVANERHQMDHVPEVIRAIRKVAPELKLGISDCARFYSPVHGLLRDNDMIPGLQDLRLLKAGGTPVDFFSFHGHRPFGLWADPRDMYQALDTVAKEGVRIHISEFGVPLGQPILGGTRVGIWTPELQADFYARVFTICFSHPAVDMVNIWLIGPDSWQPGAGLLDEKYQEKPAYGSLQKLIKERFWTRVSGTLGVDGVLEGRAFQGDYALTVTLHDGRTAQIDLDLRRGQTGDYRLVLDDAAATLRQQ